VKHFEAKREEQGEIFANIVLQKNTPNFSGIMDKNEGTNLSAQQLQSPKIRAKSAHLHHKYRHQ